LEENGKATIATIAKALSKNFSNTLKQLLSLWTSSKVRNEEIENKTFYFLSAKNIEK
jgi:guanylate kinase